MLRLKLLVFASLLFTTSFLWSQSAKKQILLIPYPAVHFVTAFDLAEVASINEVDNPADLNRLYLDSFIHVLGLAHPGYQLFEISESDFQAIQYQIGSTYREKPIGHYGIDMNPSLHMQSILPLMERMNADYVLFLTHCFIDNKLYSSSRSFDGSYLLPWARHQIDYELYDTSGKLVVLADQFELTGNLPNQENYLKKGLDISDMDLAYRSLLKDIIQKLNQYKEDGPAIYKVKKKKRKKKAKQ